MAAWKCKRCTTPFAVGAPHCPTITCKARDAFEVGDDTESNVYERPEYGPIEDDPVAQRLGLVPGDSGAADASTDPEPTYQQPDQSLGLPDDPKQLADDTAETQTVPAQKRRGRDVPS